MKDHKRLSASPVIPYALTSFSSQTQSSPGASTPYSTVQQDPVTLFSMKMCAVQALKTDDVIKMVF
uniref:Uncharacterized protein n=1 Tax=Anguilla anguilla TaxID=7936 RepID=A0A0E9WFP2_ANGAN